MKFKNGEEYYNKIYLLFNLFIAVSLIPFGYLLLIRQSVGLYPLFPDTLQWPVTISLLVAATAIVVQAEKIFTTHLGAIAAETDFREKLNAYKIRSVRKYFSFLLAALVCVAGLFTTTNALFIIAYIVSLVVLSIKRPTLNVIIEDLKLTEEEQNILIDKKDIL